ncbi:MAG: hypothetical protein IPK27_12535 [Rhodanobacteraceae bacterium]|nr:hypothetical protein [Rhodanobacteraceae bacterium]
MIAGPFGTGDGRGAIIAWHNGVLFTIPESPSSNPNPNLQVRMWNLMDPANPRNIVNAPANAQGTLGTTRQPVNAHGYFHLGQRMETGATGPFLVIGADNDNETGGLDWSFPRPNRHPRV